MSERDCGNLHPAGKKGGVAVDGVKCGRLMEAVTLSVLGVVYFCPNCDRQPGYRIEEKGDGVG